MTHMVEMTSCTSSARSVAFNNSCLADQRSLIMGTNGVPTSLEPQGEGIRPVPVAPPAPTLNLRQKLAQVRREVGYIQKRGKNGVQHYSFGMAADVAGAIGAGRPQRGPGARQSRHQTLPEPARGEAWQRSAQEIEEAPQNLQARAPH